jgi:glycosyltransferase involved in cell wall biosynthesis
MIVRVSMPINWNLNASSLTNIARHNFRELGKLMNETKSFTISATRWESTYIGDFNQHFDLLHIPNVGGYRFPIQAALHCKNVIVGLSGIDEVIYGKNVLVWKESWRVVKPLIDDAVIQWKKYIDRVKSVHVPANSEFKEMHQYLSMPNEKMTVIHHGVDHDFFQPSKNKEKTRTKILSDLGIPNNKYFLHIGENNYVRKNQEKIAEAFEFAKKSGLTHNLLIAGKNYPQIKKKLSKIPGIFFLDWVSNDQLLQLLQSADAFVLPSIHEGFGMPLVEAMSCGIPCISSKTHAPPEILSDAGILVDPFDVEDIANSMLSLANNQSLLDELSHKSLKRSNSFSWEKNAHQIFELYDMDSTKPMKDFDIHYERAAYRTLVTVCDLFPDAKQNFINSILRFDYSCLIKWAVEYGLQNPKTKDFLEPFEGWLNRQSSKPQEIIK